ncbi:hypothetical protein [Frankia sp. AgKG'84/4]
MAAFDGQLPRPVVVTGPTARVGGQIGLTRVIGVCARTFASSGAGMVSIVTSTAQGEAAATPTGWWTRR